MDASFISIGAIAIYDPELADFMYDGPDDIPEGIHSADTDVFERIFIGKKLFVVKPVQTIRDMIAETNFDFVEFELGNAVRVTYMDGEIWVNFLCDNKKNRLLERIYTLLCKEIDKGIYKIYYDDGECAVLSADEYSELINSEVPGSQTTIIDIMAEDIIHEITTDFGPADDDLNDIPRGAIAQSHYRDHIYYDSYEA